MDTSNKIDFQKQLDRYRKIDIFLTIIFVGTLLMAVGELFRTEKDNIQNTLVRGLGGLLLFYGIIKTVKYKPQNKYLSATLSLYLFWLLFETLRSFSFQFDFYKSLFSSAELFIPFILVLVILMDDSIFILKKSIRFIIYFDLVYLVFSIVFYGKITNTYSFDFMEAWNKYFVYANGLLLLTYHYFSRKIKILIFLTFALSFLFAIIQARRNQMFTLSFFLLFTLVLFFIRVKLPTYKKVLIMIFSFLIFIGATVFIFLQFQDSIFKKLAERGIEDTRAFVEEEFWTDMDNTSLILGRGIDGTYKCPALYGLDADSHFNRFRIETGYLHHILKIGIIGFGLMLLIIIGAIYRGLRKSQNYFAIAAAFYLVIYILEQYPAGNPIFTLRLLILWICVKFLWNNNFINIPESELVLFFKDLELPKFKKILT